MPAGGDDERETGDGGDGPPGDGPSVDTDGGRSVYGETWVYESIVGALPGIDLPSWAAIAIQIVVFEVCILALGAYYGLPEATVAGSVAVLVAATGSALMLRLGETVRSIPSPEPYRRLLFGSSVEVVLGVLAFVALVTHLFVFDPQTSARPLVETLFGDEKPVVVVYLTLLVLWDLTYRIGTSWWAAVVALWRSWVYRFDPQSAARFKRADLLNVGFAAVQLLLVPFVLDRPVLLTAVLGHVLAVAGVSSLSLVLLHVRSETGSRATSA